jgi:hypothetical protein
VLQSATRQPDKVHYSIAPHEGRVTLSTPLSAYDPTPRSARTTPTPGTPRPRSKTCRHPTVAGGGGVPFFFSELTFFFVALLFPSHSAVSCDCKSRDVWVLDYLCSGASRIRLSDYNTLFHLHAATDILTELNILSLNFQKHEVCFVTIKPAVELAKKKLFEMFLTDDVVGPAQLGGRQLIKFLNGYNLTKYRETGALMFGQVNVDFAVDFETDFATSVVESKQLVRFVLKSIDERFPNLGLLSDMAVLHPDNIPEATSDEFKEYGDTEIVHLVSHFESFFAEPGEMLELWQNNVKFIVLGKRASKERSSSAFTSHFLQNYPQYKDFCVLFQLAMTQPVTTVACERAFSRQNLVKTKLRNQLKTDHLEDLMRMSIGWRVVYVDSEPAKYLIEQAAARWQAKKARRFKRLFRSNVSDAFDAINDA